MSEVAEGIHRLEDVHTNWYVLASGGRLTVLDAGLPRDWDEFVGALATLGHRPEDVDAVLITHHHPDHAGNAERLRAAGARVFAHPDDAPSLQGGREISVRRRLRLLRRPWYLQYMARYLLKGITHTPAIAELDDLADGDVLDVPGSPRVVHAPGHTAGSCALLLEERSVLFSGDALVTLDVVRGPRGRQGPQIVLGADTEDAELARASLDELATTNAETVLPGHGEPWIGGVREAVKLAKRGL